VSKPFDRYNLAGRLEKFGDGLMTACENGEAIDNRVDVCTQAGAVCRIVTTLKGRKPAPSSPTTGSPAARCEGIPPTSQAERPAPEAPPRPQAIPSMPPPMLSLIIPRSEPQDTKRLGSPHQSPFGRRCTTRHPAADHEPERA
jgi:hypothetical protein